jgi:hypothetical protein
VASFQAGKHGSLISHLMFADDLLLFDQATENQMSGGDEYSG